MRKNAIRKCEKIKEEHDRLIHEKKITSQILSEYKFMKGIDHIEKFRKKFSLVNFGQIHGFPYNGENIKYKNYSFIL